LCPYDSQLLRYFHTTCSSGRAAARRTITRLRLDHCEEGDMPYSRQLELITAVDPTIELVIRADQVAGLLEAAYQQWPPPPQQQQQQQQEEALQEGGGTHQTQVAQLAQALSGAVLSDAAPSSAGSGATSTSTTHNNTSTNSISSSSSSSSSGGSSNSSSPGPMTMAPVHVPGSLIRRRRRPPLQYFSVMGDMPRATAQQLVQLLDILPVTRYLQQLTFTTADQRAEEWHPYESEMFAQLRAERMEWADCSSSSSSSGGGIRNTCTSMASSSSSSSSAGNSGSRSCSTGTSAPMRSATAAALRQAGAGAWGGWRHTCQVVLVARDRNSSNLYNDSSNVHNDSSSSSRMYLSDLAPVLGALQRLRALCLSDVWVTDLSLCAALLQPLRAFYIPCCTGLGSPGVLGLVPGLTNLRDLQLACAELVHLPDTFSNLVHVKRLDLQLSSVTGEGLEAVCGMPSLQVLWLAGCSNCSYLPASIGLLTGLEALGITGTEIGLLPWSMVGNTALTMLEWSTASGAFPLALDVVWSLVSLRALSLGDGWLTLLPPAISQLSAMTALHINVPALELPASLSTLMSLQHLSIESSQWLVLPEVTTALTQLTALSLQCASLVELPPGLSALSGLQELRVEGGQLVGVPEGITALTKLTYLAVNSPALQELPPAVQAFVDAHTWQEQE
jgi:Leucine-rich repeat (LRR) protein